MLIQGEMLIHVTLNRERGLRSRPRCLSHCNPSRLIRQQAFQAVGKPGDVIWLHQEPSDTVHYQFAHATDI